MDPGNSMNPNTYPLGGYMGRILRVDLSSGSIDSERLPEDIALDYIGGRGLATRLLMNEIDPACDPLGPENVLVVATSPITGLPVTTGGRGHIVFKSPLTGVIGTSNSGGDWAVVLKRSGFDALIIRGKSSSPVYLSISVEGTDLRESVKVLPAGDLWGMDTHTVTDRLLERHGSESARVLAIGPAGERQVRFSALINEKNRAYGRGGAGAVMGSKGLKAIVVEGGLDVAAADATRLKDAVNQINYRLQAAPATKRILRDLGTAGLVNLIDCIQMLPHRNFQDCSHRPADIEKMCGETIGETILEKAAGCYRCPIMCGRYTRVGEKRGEGPEFETVVLLGPLLGIYDLAAITRANYLCNELGLDTMSCGGSIAAAMELREKGVLTGRDTDGLDLSFGNAEALEEITRKIGDREGIGDRIAEGSRRLASSVGHPGSSMAVKGLEIPAYDPRGSVLQALGYMTGPSGACHLRGGYAVSLAFFGGAKEIPRYSIRQAPVAVRNVQDTGIIQDSLGICRFTGFAVGIDVWTRVLSAVTGREVTRNQFDRIAQRIATLERIFNLRAGASAEDDSLPLRFQNDSLVIGGAPRSYPPELIRKLRQAYYQVRGWDAVGVPGKDLCKSLGIENEL
jgi:aldehyde:ferredoxin oxidoreductase